jgi:hypothetical protein
MSPRRRNRHPASISTTKTEAIAVHLALPNFIAAYRHPKCRFFEVSSCAIAR